MSSSVSVSKYFIRHTQSSAPMSGFGVKHFDLHHTTKRTKNLVSASTRWPFCDLFVCPFHLYPSVHPAVPHFPQPNRWLHVRLCGLTPAHVVSKLPTLWHLYCVRPRQGDGRQKLRYADTMRECVSADKATEKQSYEQLLVCSVHRAVFMCADRVTHIQSLYISLMGVGEKLQLETKKQPSVCRTTCAHADAGQRQK